MKRTVALGSGVCNLVVATLFLYILSGFLVLGLMGVERVSYLGSLGGQEGLWGLEGVYRVLFHLTLSGHCNIYQIVMSALILNSRSITIMMFIYFYFYYFFVGKSRWGTSVIMRSVCGISQIEREELNLFSNYTECIIMNRSKIVITVKHNYDVDIDLKEP